MSNASVARRDSSRRNAQKSTGPASRAGKRRVRRNALKHGLTAGPLAYSFQKNKVDEIIENLVGLKAEAGVHDAAREFAHAHLYWLRVLGVQRKIIRTKVCALKAQSRNARNSSMRLSLAETLLMSDPDLLVINRYERRAANNRLRAARALGISI
jgi:hypothetical protein